VPLFETASSKSKVLITALINIPPGIYNNLYPGDIVFVGFEENAIEKPIILGKLYRGAVFESNARGGSGNFDQLQVFTSAKLPSTTEFVYPKEEYEIYKDYNTPKKLADKIRENTDLINLLSMHHEQDVEQIRLFLQPWNLEIDDGDLDNGVDIDTVSKKVLPNKDLTLDIPALYSPVPILPSLWPWPVNKEVENGWPLKLSPERGLNIQREEKLNAQTGNKSTYKTK
jgi:hypothetical protein